MELKEIKYNYIVELTAYFLRQDKIHGKKELDMVVRRVKSQCPSIDQFYYIFDESIWFPLEPEAYNNLIEFQVQLSGIGEKFVFRTMLNIIDNEKLQ